MAAFRLLRFAERTCWASGVAGLVLFGGFHLGVAGSTERELDRFATLQAVAKTGTPDQSLWSPTRVTAWQRLLSEPFPAPLAVLRIPKIRVEVPVFPGTDDRTLDRGVGHIEDTAHPGSEGNSGIAGHRDSFFRGLKDIAIGDTIELDTLDRDRGLSRRARLDCRTGRRLGARSDAGARVDARHLLSLLLRRLGATTIHRSRCPGLLTSR